MSDRRGPDDPERVETELLGRLCAAPGPASSGATTYDAVAARVGRRAARRRTALAAACGCVALALAGGGLVVLGRGGQATQSSGVTAVSADAHPSAATGGLATSADPSAAPTTLGGTGPADRCPALLPAAVPEPANFPTEGTGRLVAAASEAKAVICAYPLPTTSGTAFASSAPAGSTAASRAPGGLGAREVVAEGSWLAQVAALPAASDAVPAGGGAGCATPAGSTRSGVYLVRLEYAAGGSSWLRIVAGPCGAAADNGAVTSRQVERLVAEVRTAYETGASLRG